MFVQHTSDARQLKGLYGVRVLHYSQMQSTDWSACSNVCLEVYVKNVVIFVHVAQSEHLLDSILVESLYRWMEMYIVCPDML